MWYNKAMRKPNKNKSGIKNRNLFQLRNALQVVGRHQGVKFAYAVAKNLKMINAEIELLVDTIKPSDKWAEYDNKRVLLCIKYAEQKDGKPRFENNNYIIKDKKKFEKELDELRNEYKVEIDKQDKKLKEYNTVLLEQKTDIELHLIPMDDIPKEILAVEMGGIFDLIKE